MHSVLFLLEVPGGATTIQTSTSRLLQTHCENLKATRPELKRWDDHNQPPRRKSLIIEARQTPYRGKFLGRQRPSTPKPGTSGMTPKKGTPTSAKPKKGTGAQVQKGTPGPTEQTPHRRIFFLGDSRIKRVASAARKIIPDPRQSNSSYAYPVEDFTEDFLKPTPPTNGYNG